MNLFTKTTNAIRREYRYYNAKIKQYKNDKKEFDPNKLHINFVGFWPNINKTYLNQQFVMPLYKILNNKDFQYSSYKTDIEYFSVNSKTNEIEKSNAKIKIFYTGEDVNKNYINFKNLLLPYSDLSIGFDYPEDRNNVSNYVRYPFWILYYFGFTEDKDEIKSKVDWFNSRKNSKDRFCSYVAFHDDDGLRKKMIDIIEKIGPVSCGGASYHNDDTLKTEYNDDKAKYISHFMLNICPENVSVKGYTTEKIFQSFASGCIPFYYGSEGQPETFVNKNSVLLYDKTNDDEIIEKVKLLKNNEKFYTDFINQPRLLENAVDEIYDMNHNLKNKYKEILLKKDFILYKD